MIREEGGTNCNRSVRQRYYSSRFNNKKTSTV